jgi:hypothetical protein
MTNDEIQELIKAFEHIASSNVYSHNIIRKARWKVEELQSQLASGGIKGTGKDRY